MKQDLSDSTISLACCWEFSACVWLLWTLWFVLRPLLLALWPWRSQYHIVSWSRTDCHRTKDRHLEDYYHKALAFSRHSINLELDEETMKPEKATEAPRNSGMDPGTMKMKPMVPETRSRERQEGTHWNGQSILSRTGTKWGWRWEACNETRWHASTSTWTSCQSESSRRPSSAGLPTELGKDAPCHLRRRLHKNMVWLWPKYFSTIREESRPRRWFLRCIDVPVQHPLQQHGFLQQEERISESWDPGQTDFFKWKVQRYQRSSVVRFLQNSGETTTRMWSWQQGLTAYRPMQGSCFMAMA